MQPAGSSSSGARDTSNADEELKKVHSLDYGAERQEGAAQEEEQSAVGGGGGGGGGGRALLMHSVSIVVDFAKEREQQQQHFSAEEAAAVAACSSGRRAGNWRAHSADGWAGRESSSGELSQAEEEDDNENDEEDEEDEDDDDDDDDQEEGCLSSELARRVVLVDEADKILWSRAQSAEPRFELGAAAATAAGTTSASNFSLAPLAKGRRQSAAPTCSQHFARCSSGELAERGALSMRRNTHHQVAQFNFSPEAGCAARAAMRQQQQQQQQQQPASCSPAGGADEAAVGGARRQPATDRRLDCTRQQQQEEEQLANSEQHSSAASNANSTPLCCSPKALRSPPASSSSTGFQRLPQTPLVFCGGAARNWRDRRQSLQISLLSGSACYSHSSKSLTEEELRSEREFNEQVRSISNKSPDTAGQAAAAAAAVVQVCPAGQHFCASTGGNQQSARCATQSVLKSPAQAATAASAVASASASAARGSLKPSRVGAPRRVSFSSVDPTALARPAAASAKHRASVVAFHPSHCVAFEQSAGVDEQQQQPPLWRADFNRIHTGCAQIRQQQQQQQQHLQQKRHSTALLADSERGWLGDALKEKATQTSCQRSSGGARQSSADCYFGAAEEHNKRQERQQHSQPKSMTAAPSSPESQAAQKSATQEQRTQQQQQDSSKKQADGEEESFGKMNDNKSVAAAKVEAQAEEATEAAAAAAACRLHSGADQWQTTCTTNLEQQLEEDSDVPVAASTPKKQQPAPGSQAQLQHEQDNKRVQSIMTQLNSLQLKQDLFYLPIKHPNTLNLDKLLLEKLISLLLFGIAHNCVLINQANAKLRQEEFARLLEEHEQIVNEINRVETKISSSQTSLTQQQQQQHQQQNK